MKLFIHFCKEEEGATSIEYALIAVLVAVSLIAGASVIGEKLNGSFNAVSNGFNTTR